MACLTGPVPRFSLIPTRWLVRHEQVDDDHVDRLAKRIEAEGALFKPIVADQASYVVLDGHHRFAALVRLGCQLAPCHLVDYNDPAIHVEHWENGAPMSKIDLISNALSALPGQDQPPWDPQSDASSTDPATTPSSQPRGGRMSMSTLDRTSQELEEAAKQASSAIGKRAGARRRDRPGER